MSYTTIVQQGDGTAPHECGTLPDPNIYLVDDVVECTCGRRFVVRRSPLDFNWWKPLAWYHFRANHLIKEAAK